MEFSWSWVWLAVFIVMMIIELATMGLTTVWFAGGALAALLVAVVGGNIYVQAGVFVVVTIVLLLFTRPYVLRHQRHISTNVESMPGKVAVVTEAIDNLRGHGQVRVDGMEWTARGAADDAVIEVGTRVRVVEVRGVKLIVTPEPE